MNYKLNVQFPDNSENHKIYNRDTFKHNYNIINSFEQCCSTRNMYIGYASNFNFMYRALTTGDINAMREISFDMPATEVSSEKVYSYQRLIRTRGVYTDAIKCDKKAACTNDDTEGIEYI